MPEPPRHETASHPTTDDLWGAISIPPATPQSGPPNGPSVGGSGNRRKRGSIVLGALLAAGVVGAALLVLTLVADEEATTAAAPPSITTTAPPDPTITTNATATSAPTDPATTLATALPEPPSWEAVLASLVVAPETPRDGYDRDLFTQWVDKDGDGCDTRCEVLQAQRRIDLPGLPASGWLSLYEGYSSDDPSEFDIDHVVALSEAWDSGASTWDEARREAFANDLESGQLLAVTAATNRSKSDRDPADWQPPDRSAWCEFGTAWVGVKSTWGLTADQREVDALRNILRECP